MKPTNFGADIAFISLQHPDMNGASQVARSGKEPFVAYGPGEYEIGSVFATGFPTISHYGEKDLTNAAYVVLFDGLTMLYLGALGEAELPKGLREDVDTVDVLFVPIGGDGVLGPDDAHKLAVKLEAKVVIPMHFEGIGKKDSLNQFLKEAGVEKQKPVEKLTLKPKDMAEYSGDVVVLDVK